MARKLGPVEFVLNRTSGSVATGTPECAFWPQHPT